MIDGFATWRSSNPQAAGANADSTLVRCRDEPEESRGRDKARDCHAFARKAEARNVQTKGTVLYYIFLLHAASDTSEVIIH